MGNVILASLLGFLIGSLGVIPFIIGCLCCYRKKYLPGICLILTFVLSVLGVVIFSAFGFANKFSVLLLVIIGVALGIWIFLLEKYDSGDIGKAILEGLFMIPISMFLVFAMSEVVIVVNGYTHVFYEPYIVELLDDGVKVQYDVDGIPSEGYSIIENKIKEMRENGDVYYEGRVKLKYLCCYPLVRNNHDECSCTDERLCDICKEYASDVQVVYD